MDFCAQFDELRVNLVLFGFEGAMQVKGRKLKDASPDRSPDESLLKMRLELAGSVAERAVAEGDTPTEIAGLRLYRRSVPTACASAAYEPSLVVFLQGLKRIVVGKTAYLCDGSNFLL